MQFPTLIEATLVKRYKRFLADVIMPDGSELTVYCPNTGAMTGCAEPGYRVWLSHSDKPNRKYAYTWELVSPAAGEYVCIHSARANALVEEGIRQGRIGELQGYTSLQAEVKYGSEGSRVDFMLECDEGPCFVEVKCVTLCVENGLGLFPDAVSQRGHKHLRELMAMVSAGHRAVLVFAVQHSAIQRVAPADSIDARYGELLRQAAEVGVEILAYQAEVTPQSMQLGRALPLLDRQP